MSALLLPANAATGDLNPGWARMHALHAHDAGTLAGLPPAPPFPDSDLVVGYYDTLETRVISGSYDLTGNIIVVNHGTLILDHADFRLLGNVYVYNSGTMRIQGGTFTVLQQFAYQFASGVTGAGTIELDSALADFNGWSWSMLVADSARLRVLSSDLHNGFTTIVPMGRGDVEYRDADFSSEFVIFDSCHVALSNCDSILPWLHFPSGSSADLTLPASDTTIRHWQLDSATPGTSGIRYSLTLDTINHVLWGCFPMPGSDVTFRDSRLRTTGLIITDGDSVAINGLVNNQHYADYTLPLADRNYRLVNTDLATWNIYPGDSLTLVVNSCVFGELLAQGSSRVTIQSSICDGSGGYIGSESQAELLFLGTLINTLVVSRDRSLMLGGLSTVFFGPVTSTNGSAMLLLFCTTEREPVARDTSLLYISDYAIPDGGTVESELAITGTADIRHGPYNPVGFGSYRFSYCPVDSQTAWRPIGTTHYQPVNHDTLETWDTHGIEPGTYILKMTMYNSYGDSLEPVKAVNLEYTGVAERPTPYASRLTLPTVVRGSLNLTSATCNSKSEITLVSLDGRCVLTRTLDPSNAGALSIDVSHLAPGVYFVRCQPSAASRKPSSVTKVLIAR